MPKPIVFDYDLFKRNWYEYTMNKYFKYTRIPDDNDACWEWTVGYMPHMQIQIAIGSIKISARRATYLLFYGNIPHGYWVRNTCKNFKCVRPDHLRLDRMIVLNTRQQELKRLQDEQIEKIICQ